MNLTFIHHSSFLLETDNCFLLFDYAEGELPELQAAKPLYILASHGHHDHFTEAALHVYPQADRTWILSDDIRLSAADRADRRIFMVSERKSYQIDRLMLATFHSTDQGVAFLVQADEKSIFFAGDLNWWHWEGEPDDWNEKMKRDYLTELELIREKTKGYCDLAFLPLDPRQEAACGIGLTAFAERIDCKQIVPMHLWGRFAEGMRWRVQAKRENRPGAERSLEIKGEGQIWTDLG
ncbi:MAG: MBL fold metallo-hydrolase [Lachnospiraceae bacterium]|nr:MBL fold metallo-hydrolase [Lachnospiraceae bacterium]MDY5742034.1 MBL fold metallo-hydrolase [Lachnospiraceae bacterium]